MRFGIIQGGFDADLRRESADLMTSLEFDGFALVSDVSSEIDRSTV